MGGEGEFLLLGPTIGDKIVQTLYSNSITSENKTIRTPPLPPPFKVVVVVVVFVLFSVASSNIGTLHRGRGAGWARKSYISSF